MQDEICIDETELGRQRAQLKRQKNKELAAFAKDNPEEAAQILAWMSSAVSSTNNPNSESDEMVVPPKPWL